MKHNTTTLSLLLVFLVSLAFDPNPKAGMQESGGNEPATLAVAQGTEPILTGGGMPGWPIPTQPIPHHEPGQPARSGNASHQVTRINALGEEEVVELRGLDALLADGTVTDPLQGNYRLAKLDKLMFSSYDYGPDPNSFSVQSFEFVTPTLGLIPNSGVDYGNLRFTDIAAGDLNGDFVDEQIVAWADPTDQHIKMSIGELPGSFGRTTSTPSAVAHPDGSLDVVVRGYDQALWHLHYDGAAWGDWSNAGGGTLLSAPAIASTVAGQFDAFAIRTDNLTYKRHWESGVFSGTWELVDVPGYWPDVTWTGAMPEVDAPAAVVQTGGQLDLFRRGPDNSLRWRHYDGASWGDWQSLGGILTSAPAAVGLPADGMQVFGRGFDDALWYRTYDGDWGDWMRLETPDGVAGNAVPVLTSPAAGQVTVYLAGTEDRIWSIQHDGAAWGSWTSTGVEDGVKATPGKLGRGLQLDGIDDYVDLPDNFPSVTEFTFAAWVYWSGGDLYQRIFDFGQDTDRYMDLRPSGDDGTIDFTITTGSWPAAQRLNAPSPPIQSAWVHVAVTLDGSTGRLYIDGSEVVSQPITLTPQDVVGQNTWLGKSQYAADPAFNGKLDEVAIFGRALSASEVAEIYSAGWDDDDADLQMVLHLEETPALDGTTLVDSSGQGHDGTLHTQEPVEENDLNAGVGAAAGPAGAHLLAQMTDGSLQYSLDASGWTRLDGLDVTQTFDTGAITKALPGDDTVENPILDISTGYFTGDGRQQVVLAYEDAGDNLALEIYDIQDGFVLIKTAELTQTISGGGWPRVAAGDVDGDGVDEIGFAYTPDHLHYQVKVFQIEKDPGGDWTGNLIQIGQSPAIADEYDPRDLNPAGTLRIDAGNLVAETAAPNDEFAVIADFQGGARHLEAHLYIYDHETQADDPVWVRYIYATGVVFWLEAHATGLGLAVGNLDGIGLEEVVVTMPRGWDGNDWPNLERDLVVFGHDPGGGWVKRGEYPIPGFSGASFLDTLAVGDLDQDLVDEIVLAAYHHSIPDPGYYLQLYEFGTLSGGPLDSYALSFDDIPRAFNLAMGDFTGESLRVGPPSYRLQRSTGDIIAVLNEPPKHIDTLGGVTYDVNSTDTGTFAAYENELSQSTEMSIQVQRDWSFADGMEMGAGDPEGTHAKTSLDRTYGAHFEDATTAFDQISFGSEVKATSDDIVYYTGKDLQVWEYPVYQDNSREPAGRIMVVFPVPGPSNTGTQRYYEAGNSSCDFWYAPKHQINNVWSYPLLSSQLKDFDTDKGVLNMLQTVTVGPLEGEFWTHWQTITDTEQSSALSQNVDRLFEGQIGGDKFGVSATPFGIGVSYEVHLPYFKGTLEYSYAEGSLSTHKVIGSDETTVRVHFNEIDPSGIYNYEVTPYLYWAQDGYLVLDYLTKPKNTTFWNRYDKPDPAFILPWADGHCAGKTAFSKDIVISPPFAGNGESAVITATVHNFSPVAVNSVPVRFYLGDPAQDVRIGADQLVNLVGRDKVDVAVTWQATGTGEQRIYAVIDPDHTIAEMHDETTNAENNNNVAFGVVAMGDSGYVDPGGQVYFDYQYLTYTDTHGLPTNVFIPTAVMTETARFEMTPLPASGVVRHGFTLAAYRGGGDRDTPWDLAFDPAPAAVWLRYSDQDVTNLDESTLTLYRYDNAQSRWVDAACGDVQRYPQENELIVPVCRTGDFALLGPQLMVYLPLVLK